MKTLSPYHMSEYDAAIESIYQAIEGELFANLAEKIEWVSRPFLGKPYLGGALGEGPDAEFDQSPVYRTDCFDCVTFLNTVLALSHARNRDVFLSYLLRINYYDAKPLFEKRFHFMSADWNKQNTKAGIVTDITLRFVHQSGEPISALAETVIDRPNWFRFRTMDDIKLLKKLNSADENNRLSALRAFAETVSSEINELPYLPLHAIFENDIPNLFLLNQIPDVAVVEIVRPNWNMRDKIGTNLNVSHVGFALRKKGDLIFRHASSKNKKVADVSFVDYLRETCLPEKSIQGICVLSVNDSLER